MPDLDQAIGAFNSHQFYEAHEILELLWQEAPQPERNFYQGLLQIAAGLYHWQQKNENGAKILIGEGIYRLSKYPNYHLDSFIADTQNFLSALQRSENLPPCPKLASAPTKEYHEER